jgi:polysaccharide pyruvyl transferase CsaB
MKQAILCGYYGLGNGGDEALLLSLLQMLPPDIKPIVLSGNPRETEKNYQVESHNRKDAFALIKNIKKADYFIWGGGSLMQDVTSITSPVYYAGLMAFAQKHGLKTIAWSQGIGPLKRAFSRWLTKQVLSGCENISVRDNASAQLLAQWGFSPLLAPDPVWALKEIPIETVKSLPKPIIAVNLRPHPLLTDAKLKLLIEALNLFQKATNGFILLLPFQQSQDGAIAKNVAQGLKDNYQILSLKDPRELKGIFKEVKFAIGMRYHSLIMALAHQCPCFPLSYDPKVSQLMTELDLFGWELNQIPNDPNLICQEWLKYYENPQILSNLKLQSMIDRALLHKDIL